MAFSPNPDARHSARGFASMAPELQRVIAAKGGAAIPPGKRSFSVNRELARAAGKKGGQATHRKEVRP